MNDILRHAGHLFKYIEDNLFIIEDNLNIHDNNEKLILSLKVMKEKLVSILFITNSNYEGEVSKIVIEVFMRILGGLNKIIGVKMDQISKPGSYFQVLDSEVDFLMSERLLQKNLEIIRIIYHMQRALKTILLRLSLKYRDQTGVMPVGYVNLNKHMVESEAKELFNVFDNSDYRKDERLLDSMLNQLAILSGSLNELRPFIGDSHSEIIKSKSIKIEEMMFRQISSLNVYTLPKLQKLYLKNSELDYNANVISSDFEQAKCVAIEHLSPIVIESNSKYASANKARTNFGVKLNAVSFDFLESTSIGKKCKCGADNHLRTNSAKCSLNKRNSIEPKD